MFSGGSCECIKILLDAGACIDLEDVKGQTPLFVATSGRKLDIMKVKYFRNIIIFMTINYIHTPELFTVNNHIKLNYEYVK